jgi:hypothetical protein
MKNITRITPILLVLITISFIGLTQNDCPSLVEMALSTVEQECDAIGNNRACYGNGSLTVEPVTEDIELDFNEPGDLADLVEIHTLTLSPMRVESDEWGVALLQARANLPDTLPGQNVTIVLFGDVAVENIVETDAIEDGVLSPMQAFYLTTGIGDAGCAEAPDSGIVVQSPQGAQRVNLNVNGVDVSMGSTIHIQAQADGLMTISVLEGHVIVKALGFSRALVAGTAVDIPLGEDHTPADVPGGVRPYDIELFRNLPFRLLNIEITLAPPLDEGEIETIDDDDIVNNDGEVVIGEQPMPGEAYMIDPFCMAENPVPEGVTSFFSLASYGFVPGDPEEHEMGLTSVDIFNLVGFDLTLDGAPVAERGERYMFAAGGKLHVGEMYTIGSLEAGEHTVSLTTRLNDFSIAARCTYTIGG